MKFLRASWRLLRLLGHAKGLWIVALRFPSLSPDQQHARVQVWSMELLAHAGISLRILGQPPVTGPVMLVANHISWLDIPVMHAARHCRFVSKSDVQGWPLIGTLATAAGTLYIERSSRRDALRMVRSMQEALERGEVLAVFPEGTTGDGREMLPFHANLLQAAVAALSRGPVQVSDGVGYSDRELILRTCDEAGRLLQPSRPATALDAAFHRSAGVGDGPLAKYANVLPITTTHTRIGAWKWAHILAINLAEPFTLRPAHLRPTDLGAGEHVARRTPACAATRGRRLDLFIGRAGTALREREPRLLDVILEAAFGELLDELPNVTHLL